MGLALLFQLVNVWAWHVSHSVRWGGTAVGRLGWVPGLACDWWVGPVLEKQMLVLLIGWAGLAAW